MAEILYKYCKDENDELICIDDINKENRHDHKYKCLCCGREMIAKLSGGGIRSKRSHFAHEANMSCNSETYLHKLAKIKISLHFNFSERFPIIFKRDISCKEQSRCPFYDEYSCKKEALKIISDLKFWKGREIYNTCEEEKPCGDFKPDLLLTNPDKEYEPVFIEIYKTHESTDKKKESKYRIIETKRIQSEDDIDDIIKRGFIEGENCKTFNFQLRDLPEVRGTDVPITRFVLFKNGAAKVYSAMGYSLFCDNVFKKLHKDSVAELNLKNPSINHFSNLWNVEESLNFFQAGLVYLKRKGYPIRNCNLCDFYRYNDYRDRYMCILYKKHGHQVPPTTQIDANKCPDYRENQKLLNFLEEELNKMIAELPDEEIGKGIEDIEKVMNKTIPMAAEDEEKGE